MRNSLKDEIDALAANLLPAVRSFVRSQKNAPTANPSVSPKVVDMVTGKNFASVEEMLASVDEARGKKIAQIADYYGKIDLVDTDDEELATLDYADDLESLIPDLEEKLLASEAQLAAGCRTYTLDEIRGQIWRRYRDATQNYDVAGGGR
jgi:hypothetical protein